MLSIPSLTGSVRQRCGMRECVLECICASLCTFVEVGVNRNPAHQPFHLSGSHRTHAGMLAKSALIFFAGMQQS